MTSLLRRALLNILLIAGTAWLTVPPAFAQSTSTRQVQRIAAVVNDEAISTYDLDQRMKLMLSASGQVADKQALLSLTRQVLQALIDERLKLQEARRFEIEVSEEEIDDGIDLVARRNKVDRDTLIDRIRTFGVNDKTLRIQIQSDLAWSKLVRGRFATRVVISEEEIDSIYQRIATQAGGTQYLVAEIFLTSPNALESARVRNEAEQLIRQLQDGANFSELAAQFSEGVSASQGGDLGWVPAGQLDPAIERTLEQLEPGMIAGPVQTDQGFYIIALRDQRRQAGGIASNDAKLQIAQLVVAVAGGAGQDTIAAAGARAEEARSLLTSCEAVEQLKSEFSPLSGDLGSMKLSEMPPEFRRAVSPLPKGGVSRPVRTSSGFHVLMVCNRDIPAIDPEVRERIQDQLGQQQLAMMARRYLRDMRREATIDVR